MISPTAPFFSIVIPTYNRAGFIARTLDTVQAQTFEAWEVLVVDDGSKDDTTEVVRPFLADARFHYLPKENAERGAARNYGLARARGEYVIFLDSDDLFHPNHLATLHAAITAAATQPDFIATKYDFDRDGQRRPSDLAMLPAGPLGFESFLGGNSLACNVCVRRQNPALRLFEEDRRYAAVEDWLFLLENTQHGAAVQLVDAVTLTMNDHDQRSMRSDNQGLIQRLELAAGWMEQHLTLTDEQRQRLLGRVYYLCAIHAYADGHRGQALGFARQAAPGIGIKAAVALFLRSVLGVKVIGLLKR
ncbi:glycosyltransferase family 2 protein [Hymenobacter lapidiphilus]|uniref:Glycosyltransferase family 2 protein n=1 Tax=Hymenobacter lapidiphilus TaxID=2608003 RepID=A0A7Y7PQN7_9BACT|nr:glycosyltransferase family A protein [Hymenobacter lapidiphilus]NVO32120.1 glycosyltransferase family 2 protein [Hymenobacter lapidiphilus]